MEKEAQEAVLEAAPEAAPEAVLEVVGEEVGAVESQQCARRALPTTTFFLQRTNSHNTSPRWYAKRDGQK